MTANRRLAGALVPLLLLLPLSGCALIFAQKVKLRLDHRLVDLLDKKGPRDRFVSFLGKKKTDPDCLASFDAARCPVGLAVAPFELRAPFQLSLSAGMFDADRIAESENAVYCAEIDDVGDPLPAFGSVFWFLCARGVSGGTQVFASDSAGMIDPGVAQTFYAGVTEVDFQIENDGTDWSFRSRPRGSGLYDQLAQVPASAPSGELYASVGITNLYKKGLIGFDGITLSNTPEPAPTPEELFEQFVQDAVEAEMEACGSIDGAMPDFTLAGNLLDDSLVSLGEARLQLALLPDTKEIRKAGKRLDQSEKSLLGAMKKLDGAKIDPTGRKLRKAVQRQTDSLELVTGLGLRIDF